jgi:hypothetical protein
MFKVQDPPIHSTTHTLTGHFFLSLLSASSPPLPPRNQDVFPCLFYCFTNLAGLLWWSPPPASSLGVSESYNDNTGAWEACFPCLGLLYLPARPGARAPSLRASSSVTLLGVYFSKNEKGKENAGSQVST